MRRLLTAGSLAFALVACGGTDTPPPPADGDVTFGALTDGAVIGGPQHTALAIRGDKPVVRTELYLDGDRIGEAPFAPFTIDWTTVPFPEGSRGLRGVAYLMDGTTVDGTITVTVDNTPPTIPLVATPVTGAPLVIAPSDNIGVAALEVKVGAKTYQATKNASNFTVDWIEACGPATLEITATDEAGWRTTITQGVTTSDPSDVDCDGFASIAAGGTDCDDYDASVHPGASDSGGSIDTNCDGVPGVDADHDGYASVATGGADCNDADAGIHPSPLTWTASPLVDQAGHAITWTRGNAAMWRDPTTSLDVLAMNRAGAIEVATWSDGGAITRTPLATGATDGPIALYQEGDEYELAYPKGKELHVLRWTRGAAPTSAVDDVALTAGDAVSTPAIAFGSDGPFVAARAGAAIWVAQHTADGWKAGAVATGVTPATGALGLGDGGAIAFQNATYYFDAGSITLYDSIPYAYVYARGSLYDAPIALVHTYGTDAWMIAHAGSLESRQSSGYDAWTSYVSWSAVDHVIASELDPNHALVVGKLSSGQVVVAHINLATGNLVTVPIADADVGVAVDTAGRWLTVAPDGTSYAVTAGTPDPIDGVDRNCDGED